MTTTTATTTTTAAPTARDPISHRSASVASARVFRRWDYALFALLTVLSLAATGNFLLRWFARGDLRTTTIPFAILTLGIGLYLALYYARWLTLPLMRRPLPLPPSDHWRVGVATTFVPGVESPAMLEETVAALVAMDYAHDVWVLDEGDDPAVRDLCWRFGVRHFTRKHLSQYQTASGTFARRTKHGNYNAWLQEIGYAGYDIIVSFDPDHVPHRDFLTHLLGYFDDEKIGYVQATQAYYNQPASFIARGAAEETYSYYSSIQMTNHGMGNPIVTGCHTAHRTVALREVGGFAQHDADDLLITVHYRVAGWHGVYVPTILARGLTPVDWRGYLNQQRRWARSVLDVRFHIFPKVAAKLPWRARLIGMMHGLYYLEGLTAAAQMVLLAAMLLTGVAPGVFSLAFAPGFLMLFLAMQLCELYRQRFFLDMRGEWGLHWRAGVLQYAKWPYMLLAVVDVITRKRGGYLITPKAKLAAKQTTKRAPATLPHLVVACLICIALMLGLAFGRIHIMSNLLLVICALLVILGSLAIVASELLPAVEPYDPELARRALHASATSRRPLVAGFDPRGRWMVE
jgi:cellulose synthase (UDP-forming)